MANATISAETTAEKARRLTEAYVKAVDRRSLAFTRAEAACRLEQATLSPAAANERQAAREEVIGRLEDRCWKAEKRLAVFLVRQAKAAPPDWRVVTDEDAPLAAIATVGDVTVAALWMESDNGYGLSIRITREPVLAF